MTWGQRIRRNKLLYGAVVVLVLYLLWLHSKSFYSDQWPRAMCYEDTCTFLFENGTSKKLPRSEVPFNEDGVAQVDEMNWLE